jgi:hypothetical protein
MVAVRVIVGLVFEAFQNAVNENYLILGVLLWRWG